MRLAPLAGLTQVSALHSIVDREEYHPGRQSSRGAAEVVGDGGDGGEAADADGTAAGGGSAVAADGSQPRAGKAEFFERAL